MDYTGIIGKLKNKNMELSQLLDGDEDFSVKMNHIVCVVDDMMMELEKYEVEVEQFEEDGKI